VLRELDYFSKSPSEDTRRIAASLGARTMELSMRRPARAEKPSLPNRIAQHLRPRRLKTIGERGLWGAVAAAASLLGCYGTLALVGLLAMLGITVSVNEALWAAAIAGAALIAAVATGFNARRHRQPWPLMVAGIGAGLVVYAMFVAYDPLVEAAGFGFLIGAVALDLYMLYRAELC
jgi:arsenite methyltransferase